VPEVTADLLTWTFDGSPEDAKERGITDAVDR